MGHSQVLGNHWNHPSHRGQHGQLNAWILQELRRALQWVCAAYAFISPVCHSLVEALIMVEAPNNQSMMTIHLAAPRCLKEFDLQTCGLLKHLKGLLILSSNCDLRMRPGVSNSCVIFKTGSSSQVSCLPIFFTGKLKVHPWILLVVGTSPYGYTVIIPTPTLDINLKLESLFKTFLSQENVVLCLFVWWFYFYIFPASLNSAGFRD